MAYRVLDYLSHTDDFTITYELPRNPQERYILWASCDAGFAGCLETRRSQEGYIIMFHGPISWSSRRQNFVTLSTCEAEYVAMVNTAKQMIFLNNVLTCLSCPQTRMIIYEDNNSAIAITNQETSPTSSRTKHLDIRFRWMVEQVQAGLFVPHHIPTNFNIADIMTKALTPEVFNRLISMAQEPRSNPALIVNQEKATTSTPSADDSAD